MAKRYVHGLGEKRADLPAVLGLMRSEDAKRVAMGAADDRFQLPAESCTAIMAEEPEHTEFESTSS